MGYELKPSSCFVALWETEQRQPLLHQRDIYTQGEVGELGEVGPAPVEESCQITSPRCLGTLSISGCGAGKRLIYILV